MSQQKAQLINATENVTLSGGLDVSGITTAGNFIGSFSGTATGLSGTPNITLGIVTATLYGDGSNLDNVGSPAWTAQSTTSISGITTIDLSAGNVIYFTHNTDTTVAFANTESVQKVQFIRKKDETTTARSITWPTSIIWNSGTEPTLINSDSPDAIQVFNLTTRDQGVSWYGYESLQNDPVGSARTDYEVYAWGSGGNAKYHNNQANYSSPTQIPGTQWDGKGKGGPNHSLILTKTDNTLWTIGDNTSGYLGLNDIIPRSSPTQVPGTEWDYPINSYDGSLAFKTDGTLWVWGGNPGGVLGLNDTVYRSSPIQLPGSWSTQDESIGGGPRILAIKDDGTLWSWGNAGGAGAGLLGLGDTVQRSSPIQIPGTWASVHPAYWNSFAFKTDGTMWAWGQNDHGNFGNNDTISRSSPIQVPGIQWSNIKSVSSGNYQNMTIVKTDGTLWAWGYSSLYGGWNDSGPRSSPVQLPGTQWTRVKGLGGYGFIATKDDGTTWVWGNNSNAELGLNDLVPRSSPHQIPGTNWFGVNDGTAHGQVLFKPSS